MKWITITQDTLPPVSHDDYPPEYLVRVKGDDPRSGWVYVKYETAEEMQDLLKEDYAEYLDETPEKERAGEQYEQGWKDANKAWLKAHEQVKKWDKLAGEKIYTQDDMDYEKSKWERQNKGKWTDMMVMDILYDFHTKGMRGCSTFQHYVKHWLEEHTETPRTPKEICEDKNGYNQYTMADMEGHAAVRTARLNKELQELQHNYDLLFQDHKWRGDRIITLRTALEEMIHEFKHPDYEVWCDHDAGICNCQAINIIERAQKALNS